MKLYLDDLRNPPETWTLVRDPALVIDIIKNNDVTHLSLDHDLACDMDGAQVAMQLTLLALSDSKYLNIKVFIHSANPVGKANIESIFQSLHKVTGIQMLSYE